MPEAPLTGTVGVTVGTPLSGTVGVTRDVVGHAFRTRYLAGATRVVGIPCARPAAITDDERASLTSLLELHDVGVIACTSRHAVDAVKTLAQAHPHAVVVAVGEATATALRMAGVLVSLVGHGGGADLAAEVLRLRPSPDSPLNSDRWVESHILHPHGRRVHPGLRNALQAAGRDVREAVVYAFDDVVPEVPTDLDAILCTSPQRGRQIVTALAAAARPRWPALGALGAATADALRAALDDVGRPTVIDAVLLSSSMDGAFSSPED